MGKIKLGSSVMFTGSGSLGTVVGRNKKENQFQVRYWNRVMERWECYWFDPKWLVRIRKGDA